MTSDSPTVGLAERLLLLLAAALTPLAMWAITREVGDLELREAMRAIGTTGKQRVAEFLAHSTSREVLLGAYTRAGVEAPAGAARLGGSGEPLRYDPSWSEGQALEWAIPMGKRAAFVLQRLDEFADENEPLAVPFPDGLDVERAPGLRPIWLAAGSLTNTLQLTLFPHPIGRVRPGAFLADVGSLGPERRALVLDLAILPEAAFPGARVLAEDGGVRLLALGGDPTAEREPPVDLTGEGQSR